MVGLGGLAGVEVAADRRYWNMENLAYHDSHCHVQNYEFQIQSVSIIETRQVHEIRPLEWNR